jgi:O-antigen/teichoic acid export membrane protein
LSHPLSNLIIRGFKSAAPATMMVEPCARASTARSLLDPASLSMSSQTAVLEARRPRLAAGRVFAGAGLLSAATVGSGILAYAFFVLAARTLGPGAYGQIGVLWAAMFIGVIVLFRPLEQTTTRAVADRLARGTEVRTVVRSVAAIYCAVLALGSVAAALAWQTVTDRLFLGSDFLTAMLFAGTALYGLEYMLRGVMAGSQWFRGYALCLMADSVVRVVVAVPLVVAASKNLAAVAVAAAGLGGFLAPLWVGRHRLQRLVQADHGERFDLGAALTFAAPASVIAVADQVLINAGPVLVMLEGGGHASVTAGVVFAATMLVRIPVYVFQGVAASLLPNLTTLQASDYGPIFRQTLRRAAAVLAGTTCLIAGFAAAFGPQMMSAVYGAGFEAQRSALALLGLGVGFYLGAATFSQALLALDRGKRAALAWTSAALCFLGVYFAVSGGALMRIAIAFAVANALCCLLVALGLSRSSRR